MKPFTCLCVRVTKTWKGIPGCNTETVWFRQCLLPGETIRQCAEQRAQELFAENYSYEMDYIEVSSGLMDENCHEHQVKTYMIIY